MNPAVPVTALLTAATLVGFVVQPAAAAETQDTLLLVANRSPETVELKVPTRDGRSLAQTLRPFELVSLPANGVIPLEFRTAKTSGRYALAPPGIYCFVTGAKGLTDLTQISGTVPGARGEPATQEGSVDTAELAEVGTITVKLLCDDNQVARRHVWEPRLRKRVEAASRILETTCRMKLQVVAVDSWHSDDAITEFEDSLREFEKKVSPRPAAVAVGFTSQYPVRGGKQKLGGTRLPFHPYILVREFGSRVSEQERLEVLVHEVGHFLGAAHSPENDSVMRPNLGDNRSNLRSFPIIFDPLNAQVMNLLAREWRTRGARRLDQIASPTRLELAGIYGILTTAMPKDPAAAAYARGVRMTDISTPERAGNLVMRAIAEADRKMGAERERFGRPASDEVANVYIRAAAAVAARLPSVVARDALLWGLATALTASPPAATDFTDVDPDSAQRPQLKHLPTLRGRSALLQRFFTAAAAARWGGAKATEAAAVARQANQVRSGLSFSLTELAVEMAGIRFGLALAEGRLRVGQIGEDFSLDAYLPALDELEEAIPADDFRSRFGTVTDPRFRAEIERIRGSIDQLPIHGGSR